MFRFIAIAILPLLSVIWQALTETGSGSSGEGSGQGSGGGGGGQTGGAGSSGSGGSSGGSGTGQDTTGGAGSTAGSGTGFEGEFNPEQARALIDKLRGEAKQAAALQSQLTEAQNQLTEYETQNQNELEKATTKVASLEADKLKLQQEVRQLKVRVLGGEAGIVDTQAASLLLKWDELGEEPQEETVKAALAQMVQDRPWLLGDGQPGGARQLTPDQGATNAGRGGSGAGSGEQKPKPGRPRILAGIRASAKK